MRQWADRHTRAADCATHGAACYGNTSAADQDSDCHKHTYGNEYANSDKLVNCYCDRHGDGDVYVNGKRHVHSHSNGHCDSERNCNRQRHVHRYFDRYCGRYSDAD